MAIFSITGAKAYTSSTPQVLGTIGNPPTTFNLATKLLTGIPILPSNVFITGQLTSGQTVAVVDNGLGSFPVSALLPAGGTVNYSTGAMTGITATLLTKSQVVAVVSFPQILGTIGGMSIAFDLSTSPITTTPIVPGNVTISGNVNMVGQSIVTDNGSGVFPVSTLLPAGGTINYTTGLMTGVTANLVALSQIVAIYSGNLNMPLQMAKIYNKSTFQSSITITLTYSGSINFPATIVANATSYNGDQIVWTQTGPQTLVPTPPPTTPAGTFIAFSVIATGQPCLQPLDVISQNYVVSVTDSDNSVQIINLALSSQVSDLSPKQAIGYPSAELQAINGYPDPSIFFVPPGAPVLLSVKANLTPPPFNLTLQWAAPSIVGDGAITGYRISRESPPGSGFSVLVANTGSTAALNYYVDSAVVANTVYNYTIAAVSTTGIGPVSNAIKQNTL